MKKQEPKAAELAQNARKNMNDAAEATRKAAGDTSAKISIHGVVPEVLHQAVRRHGARGRGALRVAPRQIESGVQAQGKSTGRAPCGPRWPN